MRVITGTARGTNLASVPGDGTRPTADRVKEAVFSMLQFDIEGRDVLDLFAGSGQLAIEALSRGAERATLVDMSREATDVIAANAKKTHLLGRCRILNTSFSSFLRGAAGRETYDIIFLDPPYDSNMLPKALRAIDEGGILAAGGTVVCETDCDVPVRATRSRHDEEKEAERILADVFGGDEALRARYSVMKSVLYGRTRITLLCASDAGPDNEPEESGEDKA
ncbi:MAG: 16S rRNA (guanine(966)-N(2))-methyltransferase RsmD [Clostridia bacterium]|nr:16S rRNA (guanine(966)-N(2))-methyltransferase RsmD [Clostridia bacterium]